MDKGMINLTTTDIRLKYRMRVNQSLSVRFYPQLHNAYFTAFDLTEEGKREFQKLWKKYPPGAMCDRLVFGKWVHGPDFELPTVQLSALPDPMEKNND